MGKYVILITILLILLVGCGTAIAGKGYADWNSEQGQFYWGCITNNCVDFLKAKQYTEWRSCAWDCYSQADDFVPPPVEELFCEDTDEGKDYKNFGTVTDNKNPDGKDDYCYTFLSGKEYLFEGECVNNKYAYVQKSCKEVGATYSCIEGACVNSVCEITEVENGVVSAYPGCEVSCNEDYHLEENICVLNNQAPVLTPIGDKEINEGELLTFELSATDEDNDELSYSAENLPEGSTLEENVFTWTPTFEQAGEYVVTFGVDDNNLMEDEEIIVISVIDVFCTTPINGMEINEDTMFCPGVYNLPNGIDIVSTGITLDCNGAKLVGEEIEQTPGISVAYENDVTIKNCIISSYATQGNGAGIFLDHSENSLIENNKFFVNHILIDYGNNNKIIDNEFNGEDSLSQGILLSFTTQNLIEGNSIYSFKGNNHPTMYEGSGIYIYHSNNNEINKNNIYENEKGFFLGINGHNNNLEDNQFSNNIHGIYFSVANKNDNNHFENNVITQNQVGINFPWSENSGGEWTEGNTFTNNKVTENGIGVSLSKKKLGITSLIGNNISYNLESGILFGKIAQKDQLIENNIITHNGKDGIGFPQGVGNYQGVQGVKIKENVITDNKNGIKLQIGNGYEITDNIIENNKQHGIQIDFFVGTTVITGNNIKTNQDYGIYAENNNNLVYHNNFINNELQAYVPEPSECWDGECGWDKDNEGNYWSNYDTSEEGCEDSENNGICDSPYVIDNNGQDNFPFTQPNGWE
jgi:nitrous oxidase accessory protein NosD